MRAVLVTGANKGIGKAIVQAILERHEGVFVFMGARDLERGAKAKAELLALNGSWSERLSVVGLDVSSDASVAEAAKQVSQRCDEQALNFYGVVNNAGIGFGDVALEKVVQVNTLGIQRVCERFIPLLNAEEGRVVNITSAAGPNFVSACAPDRQAFFCNPDLTLSAWQGAIADCFDMQNNPEAISQAGYPSLQPYGLSKAFANSYTLVSARLHPHLKINACTPGFIETDMTRGFAASQGKAPADMGMKPPKAGTKAPLHLLFGTVEGQGRYYGSDAVRSPLHRYRSPGDPAYTGE